MAAIRTGTAADLHTRTAGLVRRMQGRRQGREARAHAAATGPLGNLGFELSIADRGIDAHRGHLAVESPAARGTPFTVHLPRHA